MSNWFQRLTGAIYREYDRRIRRASQISEYGAHGHDHANVEQPEDEDEGVIVNLPRGSQIDRTEQ